jgi:YjbE family integral membrane protein
MHVLPGKRADRRISLNYAMERLQKAITSPLPIAMAALRFFTACPLFLLNTVLRLSKPRRIPPKGSSSVGTMSRTAHVVTTHSKAVPAARAAEAVSETFAGLAKDLRCRPCPVRDQPAARAGGFMELFSSEFFSALVAIIIIDLVLAGDNAIVIALAARSLPPERRRGAILWGTGGAIAIRILMTTLVVWLLNIPGLLLTGGLLLLYIALKLLAPSNAGGKHVTPQATLWGAIKTIVIADAVMGLDNVLAVAGAAHGSFVLVVVGLLISIPIVIGGSTLILHWVERFPALVYIGAAVLAWTAAKMITGEPLVRDWLHEFRGAAWAVHAIALAGVLGIGHWRNRRASDAGRRADLVVLK